MLEQCYYFGWDLLLAEKKCFCALHGDLKKLDRMWDGDFCVQCIDFIENNKKPLHTVDSFRSCQCESLECSCWDEEIGSNLCTGVAVITNRTSEGTFLCNKCWAEMPEEYKSKKGERK